MFEPEPVLDAEVIEGDPFMDEEFVTMQEKHRLVHAKWKSEPQSVRLRILAEQYAEMAGQYAIQRQLYDMSLKVVVEQEETTSSVYGAPSSEYSKKDMQDMRNSFKKRRYDEDVFQAAAPEEQYIADAAEGYEEPDMKRVVSVKIQEEAADDNDKSLMSKRLEEVNKLVGDIACPALHKPSEALQKLGKFWMLPWEWADGETVSEDEEKKERKCRVLFFGHSMNKQEVKQCTLFSDYSVAKTLADQMETEGVPREEMAAAVAIPLFHAGSWGDYNRPPTVMQHSLLPYAAQVILALRPRYVVTSTKMATELLQQGLRFDARSPDEFSPNLMDVVKFSKGVSFQMLRLLHPIQVDQDIRLSDERDQAIKRLCKATSAVRKTVNAFDKLMGRAIQNSELDGHLLWTMNETVGIVVFPSEEELAQILHFRVRYIINLTSRAVKGKPKAGWEGKEVRIGLQENYMTLITCIQDVLADLKPKDRVVICCPTGVRSSVAFAALFYIVATGARIPMEYIQKWAWGLREAAVMGTDMRIIQDVHEMIQGMRNPPIHASSRARTLFAIPPRNVKLPLLHCISKAQADIAQALIQEHFQSIKHPTQGEWTFSVDDYEGDRDILSKEHWNMMLTAVKNSVEENRKKRKKEEEKKTSKKKKRK